MWLFLHPFGVRSVNINKRRFLKIKLLSLAAEARIIRKEETRMRDTARRLRKAGKDEAAKGFDAERESAHDHRVKVVRSEARHTHIAYGYLRGRSYLQLERSQRPLDWNKIETMVCRYGNTDNKAGFAAWRAGAEGALKQAA